jgi:hypothetical protein
LKPHTKGQCRLHAVEQLLFRGASSSPSRHLCLFQEYALLNNTIVIATHIINLILCSLLVHRKLYQCSQFQIEFGLNLRAKMLPFVSSVNNHENKFLEHGKIYSALFYGVSSVLVIFTNKWLLTEFHFPYFLFVATVQFFATSVILIVLSMLKKVDIPFISWSVCREIIPISLMFLGNVLCGLGSTNALNIPMFTALRRWSILMTMLGEWYLLGIKPTSKVWISVGLMVGGALLAAIFDLAYDRDGYIMVFLNNIFTAMNGVWMKQASMSGKCSKMGVLFYNSLFSGLIMTAYFIGEHQYYSSANLAADVNGTSGGLVATPLHYRLLTSTTVPSSSSSSSSSLDNFHFPARVATMSTVTDVMPISPAHLAHADNSRIVPLQALKAMHEEISQYAQSLPASATTAGTAADSVVAADAVPTVSVARQLAQLPPRGASSFAASNPSTDADADAGAGAGAGSSGFAIKAQVADAQKRLDNLHQLVSAESQKFGALVQSKLGGGSSPVGGTSTSTGNGDSSSSSSGSSYSSSSSSSSVKTPAAHESTITKVMAFEGWTNMYFIAMLLVACCMGSVLNYAIFLCTTLNSALTTAVVGTLKNVATSYIGMLIFTDYTFTWINFLGINISIIGSLYYTYYSMMKN